MKKGILLLMTFVMVFVLSACSISASSQSASGILTPGQKLAIGTLKLENTAEVVDSKQAAELLPLWRLLDDLQTSGTSSQAEIDAVVDSIQTAMTAGQIKAIGEMELTQADFANDSQVQNTANASGSAAITNVSTSQSSAPDGGLSSDMGGGMPADGGMPGGAPPSSSQGGTTLSSQSSSGTTSPASLTEQVIQLLENKIKG